MMSEPGDPGSADRGLGNEPANSARLREAAFTGVRWMGIARGAAELGGIVSLVVLARLIPPEGFGRAAVAAFVLALVSVFAGAALGAPLVQRKEIERRHLATTTTLAIAGGLALAGMTLLLGETILDGLYDRETIDLVELAAIGFLIAGVSVVPSALLQRRLDFRRLGIVEMCGTLPAIVVSISLAAFAGLDGPALVIGPLAGMALSTMVAIALAGHARPGWDRAAAGDLLRFGAAASSSSLIVTTARNIDYATLATQLGPGQVGLYWRAYQLGVEYQGKVSHILVRLAFPLYSRSGDIETIRRIRRRIVRAHAVVIFPLIAFFAASAPVLVPFLFGEEWRGAVVPAQILAIAGLFAAVQTGLGPLMQAIGKPGRIGLFTLAFIPSIVLIVILLSPHGITAVAIGIVVNHFVVLVASYHFLLRRYAGIPVRELAEDALPSLSGALLLFAAAYPLTRALDAEIPAPLVILAAAAVAAPVYLGAMRALFPASWRDLVLLWDQRPRRRGGPPETQVQPDPARSVG
ncbi:MAG TPA: oligosaccharide flippase family protein [Thermoleophilaceae bacterium]|nr:oligosaccharide flippase family protein [Thermoleophilaceae bacterium]